ncbi:MAG: sodium-dependent transporter [Chloroflexi bacterium]|nr:sodium-dependent transporter [Chloroflexota bacterium]
MASGVKREQWSSHLGFLAAAMGSAVGLGNIWRFPYLAGSNGGGAFLIPYLVGIAVCGLPLLMFEYAAGRHYRLGVMGAFKAMSRRYEVVGLAIAAMVFFILSYYLVVAGWTLGYLIATPIGKEAGFSAFTATWWPVACFVVTAVVCCGVVMLGVTKGIERTSRALLPLLAVVIVLMAGYGMTLEGRGEALSFLFKPDLSALGDPLVWARGFSQAFFSLGVGMGVMITYGSYMARESAIARSSVIVASGDVSVALLAGLAIFPLVFTFGGPPGAGPQLAFETLPQVFSHMPGGMLVGSAFYLLLFVAALTSAVSMLQVVAATISDRTGWSTSRATRWLVLPLLGLGLLSALSYAPADLRFFGQPVLDLMDTTFGTFGLLVGALVTCIAIFWLADGLAMKEQVGHGAPRRFVAWSGFLLGRYVAPITLLASLATLAASLIVLGELRGR